MSWVYPLLGLMFFNPPNLSAFNFNLSSEQKSLTLQDQKQIQLDNKEFGASRELNRDKVEESMTRLMEEIGKRTRQNSPGKSKGGFQSTGSMQQIDRSFYLSPASTEETVSQGGKCPSSAQLKQFDITAIQIEITLNQWGHWHPGYLYVLTENLDAIRQEERKNREARKVYEEIENWHDKRSTPIDYTFPVSTGLQTDLIQPLVIRANQGDCVVITLRNQLDYFEENVSLHIHGSSLIIQSTGVAATSSNPNSLVGVGEKQIFEWYIRPDEQEGTHIFHSHVGRDQSILGLTGSIIIEPMGSEYFDPITGKPLRSGWQAMITHPKRPDFREFVITYHEIGDKAFRSLNKFGQMVPQRDPFTDVYRPGEFGLNFRSEPFGLNNMEWQEQYFGFSDESLAYSAYTFGDPAMPIPRSYIGDPVKFRLVHGSGEVFHSHHPHGGTIRWLRQPKADQKANQLFTAASEGPVKYPVIRTTSDRVDAQVIGPSESMDLETECGSGLCQHLAGDFLFHCHIAQHYVAGMWSYWRVYNTLQDGNYPFSSTDTMPPLLELPDRKGRIKKSVTSYKLIGKTMDWFDKKWEITEKESDWSGKTPKISLKDWVKMMLPPAGEPGHTSDEKGQILAFDATVWDWTWEGNVAFGEKEMTQKFPFPKYKSPMPGKRPPILFEPKTGKLAWPHLKPHFGKRMPFAPNHGPAPWLEPIRMRKDPKFLPNDPGGIGAPGEPTTKPAYPGEQGRWSLCPENAGQKHYTIHFIETPITLSPALGSQPPVVDEHGLIYVLHEEEEEVREDNARKLPLVYRANVYDCVDLILKSEWEDNDTVNFQSSKINIHPHFIQFDNQASDGVIAGFSYEQSVRPFTMLEKKIDKGLPPPMNAVLLTTVPAGSDRIKIKMGKGTTPFHSGTELMVGMDQVGKSEIRRIKSINKDEVIFTEPLRFEHKKGEIASVEFVRYRYWADSDVGTVYWHDHAMGIFTWQHGAVGAMIVEPVGATYHDPKTGELLKSGPIADIHSTEPIGYGVNGSFRENVVMIQDTNPFTSQVTSKWPGNFLKSKKNAIDANQSLSFQRPYNIDWTPVSEIYGPTGTTGGGFNHRAESVARRLKNKPEAQWIFSSLKHQEPATPIFQAYLGDTIVFRLLNVMMNETHTWHLAGHSFRTERFAKDSDLRNAYHVGIAERYDLVSKAGGPMQMAGDYLHYNGRASHLAEGSWGILRVLDEETKDLKRLPEKQKVPRSEKSVCPFEAPVKRFNVLAVERKMDFNPIAPETIEVDLNRNQEIANPNGKFFILEEDRLKMASKGYQPMPLTLHVNVGDCIKINLKNNLKEKNVSFSSDMLAFDPKDSHGVNVGLNRGDQTVFPGRSKTYTFYASPEIGETASLVWDWGNFINSVRDGLFGAIIIGPKGSKYRDPVTGEDVSMKNSWQVDVLIDRTIPENADRLDYRDASLFFQDEDNAFTSFMPYTQMNAGISSVNYRSEPWDYRLEGGCAVGTMFQACMAVEGDLATPIIKAHAGDSVRIHVFGAFNEQNQVFSLEGHEWPLKPGMIGADLLSASQFGASENLDIHTTAGGPFHLFGDFVWQNHRLQYTQAGQWGYFRVLKPGDNRILQLNDDFISDRGRVAEEGPSDILPVKEDGE